MAFNNESTTALHRIASVKVKKKKRVKLWENYTLWHQNKRAICMRTKGKKSGKRDQQIDAQMSW